MSRNELLDYVATAKHAVGAFDGTEVRAGYVVVDAATSRCRNQLGEEQWASLLHQARADSAVELNLVWLSRELRGGFNASELWLRIAGALMALPSSTAIVFGVRGEKAGLVRLYRDITLGHIEVHRPSDGARLLYCWSSPMRFRLLPILYAGRLLLRAARSLFRWRRA